MGADAEPWDFFENLAGPEHDWLAHAGLANRLAERLPLMRSGATLAVQGPWGRGKTDVLARLHAAVRNRRDEDGAQPKIVASLHINPWSYGEPDLLTPLVVRLLGRLPPKRRSGAEALKRAAETIIRSGIGFGLKAVALAAPVGGGLLEIAAKPADKLLEGLFDALDKQERPNTPDPDPVAAMGLRFAELVGALVASAGGGPEDRVLVTLDDLDRCLPSRQVALLEAIHFLTTAESAACANPRAVFVIALDPRLVADALTTHFRSHAFDAAGYLNKLFDARLNLPAMGAGDVRKVVQQVLAPKTAAVDAASLFGPAADGKPFSSEQVLATLGGCLFLPDVRNMRTVVRICDRLAALCRARAKGAFPPFPVKSLTEIRMCLMYVVLAEYMPEVRAIVQHEYEVKDYDGNPKKVLKQLTESAAPIDKGNETEAAHNLRRWQLPATSEYALRLHAILSSALDDADPYVPLLEQAMRAAAM